MKFIDISKLNRNVNSNDERKMNPEDMTELRSAMNEVLFENKKYINHLKKNDYKNFSDCKDCNWKIKEIEDLKFSMKKKKDEIFDLKMEINKYKKRLLSGNEVKSSGIGYNGDQRLIDELKYDLKRNKECYDHEINHFRSILKDKNIQLEKVLKERRPYDIMNDDTNRHFWKNH